MQKCDGLFKNKNNKSKAQCQVSVTERVLTGVRGRCWKGCMYKLEVGGGGLGEVGQEMSQQEAHI